MTPAEKQTIDAIRERNRDFPPKDPFQVALDIGYLLAALKAHPEWISVEDRLPEVGTFTLIYEANDSDGLPDLPDTTRFGVNQFVGDVGGRPSWRTDAFQLVWADFWMPLPDPPVTERSTENKI